MALDCWIASCIDISQTVVLSIALSRLLASMLSIEVAVWTGGFKTVNLTNNITATIIIVTITTSPMISICAFFILYML